MDPKSKTRASDFFDILRSLLEEVLILTFPWLVPFLANLLTYNTVGIKEVLLGFGITSGFLFVGQLFRDKKTYYYTFVSVFLFMGSALSIVHVFVSGSSTPEKSVALVALDSNLQETIEFVLSKFSPLLIVTILGASLPFFLLRFMAKNHRFNTKRPSVFLLLTLAIGFCLPSAAWFIKHRNFKVIDSPYGIYPYQRYLPFQPFMAIKDAYTGYFLNAEQTCEWNEIQQTSPSFNQDVTVIVIGESLHRGRMGLYGYTRDTSPLLSSIKEELFIYENATTPEVYTVESLSKAFFVTDEKNHCSLPNLVQMSGIETWWISNQPRYGVFESRISLMANKVKNKAFINNNYGGYLADNLLVYDDAIVPWLEKALEGSSGDKKKVIFIHLMGNHIDYKKRYPSKFEKFKEVPDFWPHKIGPSEADIINAYDNSILYNDYVIYSFIEALKKSHLKISLLYFSDHGDDVYDYNQDIFGHTHYYDSPAMHRIPFIVWSSQSRSTYKSLEKQMGDAFDLHLLPQFILKLLGLSPQPN